MGNRQRPGSRSSLSAIHNLGNRIHHRLLSVAVQQLKKPPLAGFHSSYLCAKVPHRARRQANIHANDVEEILIDLAAILVLHNRDLDALRVDIRGHAAKYATDVEPMRHAAGKRDELALVEDQQGKGEMIEMTAGGVGIIGDIDVARLHVFDTEMPDF